MDRTEKLEIIATLHLLNMKGKHHENPSRYPHPISSECIHDADIALSSIESDPSLKTY